MLNREKYAKEILDIACKGDKIAVRNGKMTSCDNLLCKDCDFGYSNCNEKILKFINLNSIWLDHYIQIVDNEKNITV